MEKKACILNFILVILEVTAVTWMISGITYLISLALWKLNRKRPPKEPLQPSL